VSSLKKFLSGFATGIIVSFVAMLLYFDKNNTGQQLEEIKITRISGQPISHSSFDYSSKDRIAFITHSQGEGRIKTEIPKMNIPEARAWMTKNHGLQFDLSLMDERIYSFSYWHRWGQFSAGAGPIFSENRFHGIKIGGQFWW
jgi:hypothetical protein